MARNKLIADIPVPTLPEIFGIMDRVQKQLAQIQRHTMRRVELTPPQYFLLRQLWETDAQPLKDLATACGTTRATITGMVDVLERRGLVRRTPNPADRRSLLCKLTAAGRALRKRAPDVQQIYASCCHGLDDNERSALAGLLTKLSRTLSPSPGSCEAPCDDPPGGTT